MNLDKYIRELLLLHDCVILPGLGGFILSYAPAKIHNIQHVFSPPSKQIRFNRSLQANDGLLANHIAAQNNISFKKANNIIVSYVTDCHDRLNKVRTLKLKNIGILYYDQERNIQFKPDTTVNYLLDSFGLSSFHSSPLKGEVKIKRIKKEWSALNASSKKSLGWKVLVATPAAALIIWISFNAHLLKDVQINYSSLNPFIKKDIVLSDNNTYLNKKDIQTLPTITSPHRAYPQNIQTVSDSTISLKENCSYHVIAGCFRKKDNADKLVVDLNRKGFNSKIIGQNNKGLYMVCYLSSSTEDIAKGELKRIRYSFDQTAWLYKAII